MITRRQLRRLVDGMSEADIDKLAARIFETTDGQDWLRLHTASHPDFVQSIRDRIARWKAKDLP